MNKSIFEFQDYKAYLRGFISSQPLGGRGLRIRMAKEMSVQPGFVTKVLSSASPAHLSLEQADSLLEILNLSDEESEFFLLMVSYSRAGTTRLREKFRTAMKKIINRRLELTKAHQSRSILSPEDHMTYYSSWYYAAIRVAVSIGRLQTKEALSARLQLPLQVTVKALDFLTSRGLVSQKGDHYVYSDTNLIHLSADHPMVARNHINWRTQALKSFDSEAPCDLHYTYIATLSENDALQIRSFLVEAIKEVVRRATPSKEENIYAFCLDYFEV